MIAGVMISIQALLGGMKLAFCIEEWKRQERLDQIWTNKKFYLYSLIYASVILLTVVSQKEGWILVQYMDLVVTTLLLAAIDFRYKTIPNDVLGCLFIGQMLYLAWNHPLENIISHLILGLFVFSILFLLCILSKEKIGIGDAKLVGVMTVSVGWAYMIQVVFLALICAFFYSIGLLMFRRVTMKTQLPFVPFLVTGMALQFILIFI